MGQRLPEPGNFRVIGTRGDSEWPIGEDQECLKKAVELAENERCVGDDIVIINSEGETVYP